jgi:hypothetical protein
MKLYDEITALFFLLAFERQWDSALMEYRTKARIIEFLRYVLDKSP